jgi:kumamolisin
MEFPMVQIKHSCERSRNIVLAATVVFLAACNPDDGNTTPAGACIPVGATGSAAVFNTVPQAVGPMSGAPVIGTTGHIPGAVRDYSDQGRTPEVVELPVTVTLRLNNEDDLNQRIAEIYQPGNTNYHHFLSPQEFSARYSPTSEQVADVQSYLESQGLHGVTISSSGYLMHAQGAVGALNQAFRTELHEYADATGKTRFAPANEPSFPDGLAIRAVHGLENVTQLRRFSKPLVASRTRSVGATGPGGGFSPADLATAYNFPTAGNGAGQSIALVELDGYKPSDIAAYASQFGLLAPSLQNISVDSATNTPGANQDEVTLDIELATAIAPGASILVYEGLNTSQGLLDIYDQIATDNKASVVSISWGMAESEYPSSYLESESAFFRKMVVQGMSVFAAAGDAGAYEDGSKLSVADPAAQPFVTAVGGTHLDIGTNGVYVSETTWNDGSVAAGAGGGGVSAVWAQPTWQNGIAKSTNQVSATMRNIPDVSLNADPDSGYAIYLNGSWMTYGGTSCGTPLWAGFMALVNQQRKVNGLTALGFANPYIYALNQGTRYAADFHDISDGSTNLDYTAVPGFDDATGWGSFNGKGLFQDLSTEPTISETQIQCPG